MAFEDHLPNFITCGTAGWQFTKREEIFRQVKLQPLTDEQRRAVAIAKAERTEYERLHPMNKTLRYSDQKWREINRRCSLGRGRRMIGETSVRRIVWVGSQEREARSALKDALGGYKILWNDAGRDVNRFADLCEMLNDGRLVPIDERKVGWRVIEGIGQAKGFKVQQPEYDCCDRYDFGPWTRLEK